MKVEHALGSVWAAHLKQMVAQVNAHEAEALRLDGQAAAQRREAETLHRHASALIGLIAEAEHLPPSLTPYRLSEDGTKLIGETNGETV